ncbi:MAG: hypothetical protein A3D94_03670 [Alphaproteobacteria bacterium RIFCSPHIGHO2_12_FULL_66_14]|nr:MAG: hypothetical protein A3D94_03670 [Alphaproteobacteria bacterium RIFCSPHIGHO2_12_FULL_66_14]
MTLYLEHIVFDGRVCAIELANREGERATIKFNSVRNIVFYKETDFYPDIAAQTTLPFLCRDGWETQVKRVVADGVLENLVKGRYDAEEPLIFRVWTPDECFEILCFEEPEYSTT